MVRVTVAASRQRGLPQRHVKPPTGTPTFPVRRSTGGFQLAAFQRRDKIVASSSSLHPPVKLCLCVLKGLRSEDTHLGISRVVSRISESLLCPVKEHSTGAGSNGSCCHGESPFLLTRRPCLIRKPFLAFLLQKRRLRVVGSHFVAMTTTQATKVA